MKNLSLRFSFESWALSFKIPIKENVRKTTRYLITPLSKLFTHRKQ